eukprot:1350285-Karenia_brevis.AAC.1
MSARGGVDSWHLILAQAAQDSRNSSLFSGTKKVQHRAPHFPSTQGSCIISWDIIEKLNIGNKGWLPMRGSQTPLIALWGQNLGTMVVNMGINMVAEQ